MDKLWFDAFKILPGLLFNYLSIICLSFPCGVHNVALAISNLHANRETN